MVTYKHNQPYYELHFSGLADDAVNVLSFEGEEEISNLFEYRIELVSKDAELDASKILNKAATFFMNRGDEDPIKIHGIISNFEQFGKSSDYVFYKAVLVPQIWRLNLIFQNEVYQNMDIKNLIEMLLEETGLSRQDYKIELKGTYPKKEYTVQYRETSFNFLSRRLEHLGIFYYFDHSGDKDTVVFTNSNSLLKELPTSEPLGYNINRDPLMTKESIYEISCREKVVTGMVQLKDYNYMFPEKQLMAQSHLDSNQPGFYYDFGDDFENENEAETLAKIRNQEFLSAKKIFHGKSDSRHLAAGYKFKLERHYRQSWNAEYIITKVSHKGNQHGLFGLLPNAKKVALTYENSFTCIPSDIEYKPVRKTPIPKISGIMSAKLESGAEDEYAFIDDHGRYKAKMLFDISDNTNGEASLPIRLTQSYSGSGYGAHFPNHAGNELLWACVDGNVDRPIGIGTVPNPSQATPVSSKNKTQNIIRTASGNEFIMDDKSKEAQIILATPDANKILFDDKDDKIEIVSKDKHKVTMDDKNKKIVVKSKDGHQILIDDENDNITIQSKGESESDKKLYFIKIDHKNESIEATSKEGHFIKIIDKKGSEKIELSDKPGNNHFLIDIKGNKLVIETKEGNIDMLAPKGDINIKSKNLKMDISSDINIKGTKITEKANSDFKLTALNIEAKADMDMKLEGGMNFTAKGGMAAKVEGGISADFKGGATATLKAGMVMIN